MDHCLTLLWKFCESVKLLFEEFGQILFGCILKIPILDFFGHPQCGAAPNGSLADLALEVLKSVKLFFEEFGQIFWLHLENSNFGFLWPPSVWRRPQWITG